MIGAYYRLSLADEDKDILKKESNSIANQKELIRGYLRKQADLCDEPIREFIDDGYSGTSTHRPAFEEMMECVKKGQVKTIVVKDFSRFARDYMDSMKTSCFPTSMVVFSLSVYFPTCTLLYGR